MTDTNSSTHLSSTQNPKVKQLIRLRERSEREETGQFIIEGYRELFRAIHANKKIDLLFICQSLFLGTNEIALINKIKEFGTPVFECTEQVFKKISYRDRPDGLLAIAPQEHIGLNELNNVVVTKKNPLFVIAEAIEKPGNLGTILRSSDAVGVDALIVCDRCTDIHNPNVVRASVGTLFTIPVIEASGKETFKWLKDNKISILAATPHAKLEYTDVNMTVPLAIAVGTEQLGLTDLWMKNADIQVRIPMHGVADSLNVAMATTLLLYEAVRQRK